MLKIKRSPLEVTADSLNVFFLFIFGFICFYPFYHIFLYTLSIPTQTYRGVYLLPVGFTLQNYIQVFKGTNLGMAAFISLSRTVVGTAVTIFFTSMFAYLMTQPKLKFRSAIYRMVIFTMYVGAGLIPWYILMKTLGLKNSFLLYIIPSALDSYFLILIKTYIEQLPPSLQESAMIDGAGPFKVFLRIVLPLCTPILATAAIFNAVGQWNTWQDNFFLVDSKNLQTLQIMLLTFIQGQSANQTSLAAMMRADQIKVKITPMSVTMTVTMVVTLPIIIVYPLFQKYFVKGIMIGAIKG